ncbi:TFIIS N-terminal domain-containing protein [Psidium guajava]|nr:TFIIS N-terminal domain-containing protein [Psidium guajava]
MHSSLKNQIHIDPLLRPFTANCYLFGNHARDPLHMLTYIQSVPSCKRTFTIYMAQTHSLIPIFVSMHSTTVETVITDT